MAEREAIRGVLLDSGDTLVRPIGGAWFPGRHFRPLCAEHGLADLRWEALEAAIDAGMRVLEAHPSVPTEEEECRVFAAFYAVVLRELGCAEPNPALTDLLARGSPEDGVIEPFPETREVLSRLKERGLRLGVVSNAWPSLERRYRELGLRDFFDAFVISTQVGVSKPDPAIYRRAIDDIGLPPSALLFVDDWPGYVRVAMELGMRGAAILRGDGAPPEDVPWVRSLEDLEALLD